MHRKHLLCLLILFLSLTAHSVAWSKQRLAILEFTGKAGLSFEQLLYLSDQVRAEAQSLVGDQLMILTRETLSELTESPEVLEACTSGCEVQVGRALQAHWLLAGQVHGDEEHIQASIKLHDVRKGISIDIEFAKGSTFNDLVIDTRQASGRLLTHLMKAKDQKVFTEISLPSAQLPAAFNLSSSDTLGLPIALLKQYDRALIIDDNHLANIEKKIEVWSRLTRYSQYKQLVKEANKRLAYWRLRFKRKVQCNRTWQQLEQILALKKAISDRKKQSLVESFLNACGRTLEENPHLNAPYFVNKRQKAKLEAAKKEAKRLRAERKKLIQLKKKKRLEADKKKAAKAQKAKLIARNQNDYSVLETHFGGSYDLKFGSLSAYHLRFRIQPMSWWNRQVFIDAEAAFRQINHLTEADVNWAGEWSGAIGLQWLNQSNWSPSLSLGYQLRSEKHYGFTELGIRYRPIADWFNLHLALQFLQPINANNSLPNTIDNELPRVTFLDEQSGELRLTLWASTGTMGLSLILLCIYVISSAQIH